MCGCNKTTATTSSLKICKSGGSKLADSRNKLAILYNITQEIELKSKYEKDKNDIDELMKQIAVTGVCPSYDLIIQIENEVNNEYSKYSNT